jgi:hypothetical protein
MGIGSPRLRKTGACVVLVLAAWLLPARAAHADGLPQVAAVTAATTAVESVAAPAVEAAEATEATVTQAAAPLAPAPLLDTGSRAVTATVVQAAARVSQVTAPAVRRTSPVVRRATALTHRVRAVASHIVPAVVSGVVPKTVATAPVPVPAAAAAPAESSPGAAVPPRHARPVAAVSAGRQPARVVRSDSRAASPAAPADARVQGASTREAAIAALRPFAPAPHGPAAHDVTGSAAGAPAAAPSRFQLPFSPLDVLTPAVAAQLEGVVLLLHVERPD